MVIGAQNAFVIRQGIRRDKVTLVVAICALSDMVLVVVATAGIGALVAQWPSAMTVLRFTGAAFLLCYGMFAAWRAYRPSTVNLSVATGGTTVVLTCLALTWLNPHVHLDLLMLGSVANSWGADKWWFGVGSAIGSWLWFGGIGYGSRSLADVLARPAVWRGMDAVVAVVMVTIAVSLVAR
ncbi:L-lysine exporter family protein LysE/ArgO [Herbihabitans rhizosphaerae]|uniref:L-lysine exporter family protein LysE/ArgO n=2 Tax=Herbihabitans rhizosphaerae TaxID=1872711 RepID=A0A4Q7L2C1_9PSEU|nr:L-lysine exporter family protein LysE/ArgO [Herbihabitans rhizosphaerae]